MTKISFPWWVFQKHFTCRVLAACCCITERLARASALCVDRFHFVVSATSAPISMGKTSKLHFSGDCSDSEVQRQIKEQYIQLLNVSMAEDVCQADTLRDRCKADNVNVTCYNETRWRRGLSGEFKGYHYCNAFHCPVMERPAIIINFMVLAILHKAHHYFEVSFYKNVSFTRY